MLMCNGNREIYYIVLFPNSLLVYFILKESLNTEAHVKFYIVISFISIPAAIWDTLWAYGGSDNCTSDNI